MEVERLCEGEGEKGDQADHHPWPQHLLWPHAAPGGPGDLGMLRMIQLIQLL